MSINRGKRNIILGVLQPATAVLHAACRIVVLGLLRLNIKAGTKYDNS